jgi:hypothetical protein
LGVLVEYCGFLVFWYVSRLWKIVDVVMWMLELWLVWIVFWGCVFGFLGVSFGVSGVVLDF